MNNLNLQWKWISSQISFFQSPWFLKISIGIDAEKAISVVSLHQYHQYTYIYTSYKLHTMLPYREVELVMVEFSEAAKLEAEIWDCISTLISVKPLDIFDEGLLFSTFERRTPMDILKVLATKKLLLLSRHCDISECVCGNQSRYFKPKHGFSKRFPSRFWP